MTPVKQCHTWLARGFSGSEYLDAAYYSRILHPYIFEGLKDLEIFQDNLKGFQKSYACRADSVPMKILELGCGSGRGTDIVYKNGFFESCKIDLLDLSGQMLESAMKKYRANPCVRYMRSDILSYLETTKETYDFVFALWSLSHSVHQFMDKCGEKEGRRVISEIMRKFLTRNLIPGGCFFIIHFDSLSEEQRVSLSIRRKTHPFFKPGVQSPSKRLLDNLFKSLERDGLIRWHCRRYVGEPICYDSMQEALEVFFNFHMECEFNANPGIDSYISEVTEQLELKRRSDGKIYVPPGCFVYVVERHSSV